jgi:K+-transporting ATPase ATPase C chain
VKNQFVTAVRVFITLTVLTGAIYPLAVTAIGQMVFKKQAMGSIISKNETGLDRYDLKSVDTLLSP